jgi:acyl-CoA thioester hydrolase
VHTNSSPNTDLNAVLNLAPWWFEHRVSYGETDAMGYLYYAEYLHVFERARGDFMRGRGMSYADIERQGIMLPVREARCRYRQPAHYDDVLRVRLGISELGRASLSFVYAVYDAQGKTLHAEGMTQHACAATATGRAVPMPDWFRDLFSKR